MSLDLNSFAKDIFYPILFPLNKYVFILILSEIDITGILTFRESSKNEDNIYVNNNNSYNKS